MCSLNLDYILEIKHIAKCGFLGAFHSDFNKKRNSDSVFFRGEGPVFMLWNASDAKSGCDAVYKQLWKFSAVFSQPVFWQSRNELCVLEAFLLRATIKDPC